MVAYETKADKANEDKLSNVAGGYLGVTLKKTPDYFPADFVSQDERIYVECRCRSCTKDRFPEIIITATKWIELLRLTFDELNPKVYLVVAWSDCIGIRQVEYGHVKLVPFTRSRSKGTRRDEVMVAIPTDSFNVVECTVGLTRSANWI